MSWLEDVSGKHPAPYVPDPGEPKVKDPTNPNRMVSDKPANRPFLAYVFSDWSLYLRLINDKAIKNTVTSKKNYTMLGWRDSKKERLG
jgi:hypothetical protein